MKISLKLKLMFGMAVILFFGLAVLFQKAQGIFTRDKISSLKSQSSQISFSLAVAAAEKIKRLDRHLRLLLTHNALKTPEELRPSGEEMLRAGMMVRKPGEAWSIHWLDFVGPVNQNIGRYVEDFLAKTQNSFILEKLSSDEHSFSRVTLADGQPVFLMFVRMTKLDQKQNQNLEKIAVSVLTASTFFDLVAPFKGGLAQVMIVDKESVAYAHPSFALTGMSLPGHPVLERVVKQFASSEQFVQEIKNPEDTLVASYDAVSGSNLTAVSVHSLTENSGVLSEMRVSFALLGLGLLIFAALFSIVIVSWLKKPILRMTRVIDDLSSGRTPQITTATEEELGELASSVMVLERKMKLKEYESESRTANIVYQEKMSAFQHLSAGLVNELRTPLIGILGHTQLAREKIREPLALRRHLDLIETEVRKTKELVEDISQYASRDRYELENINIYETLSAAIEQACRKIHGKNIKIVKNLESMSPVTANPVLLRRALVNVLHATVSLIQLSETQEAGSEPKEIIVRLENVNESAVVTIRFDSSTLEECVDKIFDPFLKVSDKCELGLDLALAKGILEAHDSEIDFESYAIGKYQFLIRLVRPGFSALSKQPLDALKTPRADPTGLDFINSPFEGQPGLEMKGLKFALPNLSMSETVVDEASHEPLTVSKSVRKVFSRIPLENLKVRVRKPTLRT